jgi:hypothetical protein
MASAPRRADATPAEPAQASTGTSPAPPEATGQPSGYHLAEQHLQRYLTEFQFRYNNRFGLGVSDRERTAIALKGNEGKRLTYRPTN